MDLLFQAVRDIANPTTVRGGFFILNSSAFELTRLVTGQMSGVVDVRNRLLRDFPQTRELFTEYGGGRLLGTVRLRHRGRGADREGSGRRADGRLGPRPVPTGNCWTRPKPNFGSMLAASNATLHAQLVEAVNAGDCHPESTSTGSGFCFFRKPCIV